MRRAVAVARLFRGSGVLSNSFVNRNGNLYGSTCVSSVRMMCSSTTALRHEEMLMPDIMEAKNGIVEKWLKREGESFKAGESLCEVLLMPADLMVAVDAKEGGIMAKHLVPVGQTIPANSPILLYFTTKEEYFEYIDEQRDADEDIDKLSAADEISKPLVPEGKKPDTKVLLRVIKRLINEGSIKEGSDLAKKVMSLARNGNEQLISSFEASFEGETYDDESFDEKFFIENITDLVAEIRSKETKE